MILVCEASLRVMNVVRVGSATIQSESDENEWMFHNLPKLKTYLFSHCAQGSCAWHEHSDGLGAIQSRHHHRRDRAFVEMRTHGFLPRYESQPASGPRRQQHVVCARSWAPPSRSLATCDSIPRRSCAQRQRHVPVLVISQSAAIDERRE